MVHTVEAKLSELGFLGLEDDGICLAVLNRIYKIFGWTRWVIMHVFKSYESCSDKRRIVGLLIGWHIGEKV